MQQLESIDTHELKLLLSAAPESVPLFATDNTRVFTVSQLITREIKEGIRHFCEVELVECHSGGRIVTQPVSAL